MTDDRTVDSKAGALATFADDLAKHLASPGYKPGSEEHERCEQLRAIARLLRQGAERDRLVAQITPDDVAVLAGVAENYRLGADRERVELSLRERRLADGYPVSAGEWAAHEELLATTDALERLATTLRALTEGR